MTPANLPTSGTLPPPPVRPEAGYGHYGAAGVSGGLALARQLDERAGINDLPPVSDPRGLAIRLRYLAWDEQGLTWLRLAQITVTERTIARWNTARQRPLPANLEKIDRAFWACRRHNLVGYYKQRLWDGGRGTRIEIHPVDQQHVAPNRRRDLNLRTINVRTDWRRVVDAWNSGDQQALDDAWNSISDSLGSDHGAYRSVSYIGFGI
ncbi:transcriptional regulator [Streptomyces sp. NBC_00564]|uniref:transcriptional regulator n=1 Tax=Streptomyces sp. NBC_00564 TaxID=2903663 RepID=UPI002FCD8412|nr:transcriptional regulator [Streptomyces sp. NBC_00564]